MGLNGKNPRKIKKPPMKNVSASGSGCGGPAAVILGFLLLVFVGLPTWTILHFL